MCVCVGGGIKVRVRPAVQQRGLEAGFGFLRQIQQHLTVWLNSSFRFFIRISAQLLVIDRLSFTSVWYVQIQACLSDVCKVSATLFKCTILVMFQTQHKHPGGTSH